MPLEERETWNEYSRLLLQSLEDLKSNQETLRKDIDQKFSEINCQLVGLNGLEKTSGEHRQWIQSVNDVCSPVQMKEAKDEIYKQKGRWIAAISIITFLQIVITLLIAFWRSMSH